MKSERYEACGESLCEETITNDTADEKVVIYSCAQNREVDSPERGTYAMTKQEAERYIARLTFGEKLKLNELLKVLEQKRPPSPSPQASTGTNGL